MWDMLKLVIMASIFVAEAHAAEAPKPPEVNAFTVAPDFCRPGAVAGSCGVPSQFQSPGEPGGEAAAADSGAAAGSTGGGGNGGGATGCR